MAMFGNFAEVNKAKWPILRIKFKVVKTDKIQQYIPNEKKSVLYTRNGLKKKKQNIEEIAYFRKVEGWIILGILHRG